MPFALLNPWLLLAALLTILASFGGGYAKGRSDANSNCAEARATILEAAQEAQKAAALEIAKIEITHRTIKQKVEREIQTVPVYVDCKHSPSGLRLVNQALANGQPVDGRKLPDDAGRSAR